MTGTRITTSAVHIHHWITRLQLHLQRTGETENMKKNQPTLLTEGCVWFWEQVSYYLYSQ